MSGAPLVLVRVPLRTRSSPSLGWCETYLLLGNGSMNQLPVQHFLSEVNHRVIFLSRGIKRLVQSRLETLYINDLHHLDQTASYSDLKKIVAHSVREDVVTRERILPGTLIHLECEEMRLSSLPPNLTKKLIISALGTV